MTKIDRSRNHRFKEHDRVNGGAGCRVCGMQPYNPIHEDPVMLDDGCPHCGNTHGDSHNNVCPYLTGAAWRKGIPVKDTSPFPFQQEIKFSSGVVSSPAPPVELIWKSAIEALANRMARGIRTKGTGAINSLTNNTTALMDREFILNRLGHTITHCYKAIARIIGTLPPLNGADEADGGDAGAILFGGALLAEHLRVKKLPEFAGLKVGADGIGAALDRQAKQNALDPTNPSLFQVDLNDPKAATKFGEALGKHLANQPKIASGIGQDSPFGYR